MSDTDFRQVPVHSTTSGLFVPDSVQDNLVPNVIQREGNSERAFDIFSRMLNERIVFLNTPVDSASANIVIAQLLHLEAEDPTKDITLQIDSPGGSIYSGLAIYDTMMKVKPDVATVCCGIAMSMGSFLLAAGAKGKRYATPNSRILIHQPSGGVEGQATDIEIHAREILDIKRRLYDIYSQHTGQDVNQIKADCERDHFMSPEQAQAYGLIDGVMLSEKAKQLPPPKGVLPIGELG